VLDAILDNETELTILEHTTDTAGYTELVFALFDLLGTQFAPRIRDLSDQRLYRFDSGAAYHHLGPLLKGKIRVRRVVEHRDDLLRVAGSLKRGHVTASLLIGKLQANPRRNALTRALQEYDRVAKTLIVLRYLGSEAYRRRIGVQLNKGEALHALRRFLFFAHQGQVHRAQPEDQANQASCRNLVTHAMIAWNTVYMAAVIDRLKSKRGADRAGGPRAPLAGAVRPHQPVRAIPVPSRPLGRQEAFTTHQSVIYPTMRSVGFCPFTIPRPTSAPA
jgi:TnpA family transposase